MKTAVCCPKDMRQGCLKNQHLFFTDKHKKRLAKIVSELKKLEGVSFSNSFPRQCSKRSDDDRLVILENKGKNLCVIAIYVASSNVRQEMDCNSLDLNYFKRVQIKKIRKDEGLGCSKQNNRN